MNGKSQARHCETIADVLEATYRALIGASIAFEHGEFARLRQGESA